jgi:flavin reductase
MRCKDAFYAVIVLPADLASSGAGVLRFTCADWAPHTTGALLLDNALTSFDCHIEHQMDLGTHRVFIGKVVAVKSRDGAPLAYSQRKFCGLQALEGI